VSEIDTNGFTGDETGAIFSALADRGLLTTRYATTGFAR